MRRMLAFFMILGMMFPVLGRADDAFQTITFPSQDQLTITADLYMPHASTAPFIVLFHQATYSRGEYREIAPKLNLLGFNAMAIDQRSGDKVHDVVNETAKLAKEQGLSTTFIDALPDLLAAIDHAKANYASGKLIIWGSSYSSALVLKIAGDYPDIADAMLAFSPGEYYDNLGATFIADSAKNIVMPVFITSAFSEQAVWQPIYDAIVSTDKTYFLPESGGVHGSSTLLESTPEHAQYWTAVEQYLARFTEVQTACDIKANGSDGPVTVAPGGTATLTIGLQTADTGTENKDWWVFAETPFGSFSWVYPDGWQAGEVRAILFPLLNLEALALPPALPLPAGTYTFYFAVDINGDGVKDQTYSDSVQVIFQ